MPIPPGLTLSYGPAFLHPLPTPAGVKIPYDIIPPRPKMGIPDETGPGDSAGDRSLWRGTLSISCLIVLVLIVQVGYVRIAVVRTVDFDGRSG